MREDFSSPPVEMNSTICKIKANPDVSGTGVSVCWHTERMNAITDSVFVSPSDDGTDGRWTAKTQSVRPDALDGRGWTPSIACVEVVAMLGVSTMFQQRQRT